MQVYTQILEGDEVDWCRIKSLLDHSGQASEAEKFPYVSDGIIVDADTPKPTVTATLYMSVLQS